jgi:hypothetical protein
VAVFLVTLGYSLLRFKLNTEFKEAPWEQLYNLTAAKPFGHRVLIPLLSRPIVEWIEIPTPIVQLTTSSIGGAFWFYELVFAIGLFLVLRGIFREYLGSNPASFFACAFFFVLPFPFLLRHFWPIYYPYDTPAMFFMAAGLWALLRQRWSLALLAVMVGAANRETIVFLPLVALVLYVDRIPLRRLFMLILLMCAGYAAVRFAIALALPDNPSHATFIFGKEYRIVNNMKWLRASLFVQVPVLLSSLGFLPLFWLLLRGSIPPHLTRIRFVAWGIFLLLLVFGNVYEPRIFGELVLLLFVPVSLAAYTWMTGRETPVPAGMPAASPPPRLAPALRFVDRWGLLLILGAFVLALVILTQVFPKPG